MASRCGGAKGRPEISSDFIFIAVASLAIIIVGLAKGGFAGLGAVAMPILVLVMDPIEAAAMMLPILIAQDVVSVWSFRKSYDGNILRLMLPGAAIGIGLGWLLATSVSSNAVRALVGLIAVTFGVYRLSGIKMATSKPIPQWLGMFWGGVSGFTSHVAHAGGPPFQIWAMTRGLPHTMFIGTSSIFFAIVNWMKVPAYFALGQFTASNLKLTLAFMPLALLSTLAGVWIVRRISAERFFLIINLLMVFVGLELLRVAFWPVAV